MYEKTITIKPESPNEPLVGVWIGRGSYAKFLFADVPTGAQSAFVAITLPGTDTPVSYVATDEGDGVFSVVIAGENFSAIGSGTYEFIFADADGNRFSAGNGTLNVRASALSGEISPMVPAYDPITQLFHTVTVVQNELGQYVLAVAQVGVSHA